MIHQTTKKQISFRIIGLLFILISFSSCSKDGDQEIAPVEDIQILISGITLNSAFATVTWDIRTNQSNLKPYVFYKKVSDTQWNEIQQFSGKIENLDSGTRYQAKAVMKGKDVAFESNETTFLIPGFNPNGQLFGRLLVPNSRYSINSSSSGTNFIEAASLSGYLKVVGFDSLPLKKIEVFDERTLHIELPDNTQDYFLDDIDFINRREFTIGLFSGEYYTEISSSIAYNEDNIFAEGMRHFNIFNKTPRLNSLVGVSPHPSLRCDNMIRVQFEGNFWKSEEDSFISTDVNIPISVNIIFYDAEGNIVNAYNLDDQVQNNDGSININDCTQEMWFYSGSSNIENVFTANDRLHFNLYESEFPSGTYFIKYMLRDRNDFIWESNTLEFQIEY